MSGAASSTGARGTLERRRETLPVTRGLPNDGWPCADLAAGVTLAIRSLWLRFRSSSTTGERFSVLSNRGRVPRLSGGNGNPRARPEIRLRSWRAGEHSPTSRVCRRETALCLAALIALLGGGPAAAGPKRQPNLAQLARCIADRGARFYGAHWCPYCRKQKEYFDGFAYLLPYVECYDGPKSNGMNARCRRAGIQSFPTWVLPNGSVARGIQTPRALAADTGCPLR